ncbi:hypothetical protein NVV94_15030 [Pseudomonas sp. LS1212]|uniref:hypothetical protein n=1 Tax=Pseudomonas sp. LS1212 TaxID=2972478 RepID=UPI00215BB7B2|nr:hypothetical protein [Pseudomonas sp. LS1212]UVJ42000.1 hypothetical protein NVV94_15030 [Pseudomonas sp. LS1212]
MTETRQDTEHYACWAAAWPSRESVDVLKQAGVKRTVHLTTFYNAKVRLNFSEPLPHCRATITTISEWRTRRGRCIVAELACEGAWGDALNAALSRTYGSEERTYKPHLTVERNAPPGRSKAYQHLVGIEVEFDRHGIEQFT